MSNGSTPITITVDTFFTNVTYKFSTLSVLTLLAGDKKGSKPVKNSAISIPKPLVLPSVTVIYNFIYKFTKVIYSQNNKFTHAKTQTLRNI